MAFWIVRGLVAGYALATLSACDPSWQLEVTARVSPEVQAAVTFPAQLLVDFEKLHRQEDAVYQPSEAGVQQLVVACTRTAQPIEATWRFSAIGCAVETRVTAWLTPLQLDGGLSCAPAAPGAYPTGGPATLGEPGAPQPGEPSAQALAFEGDQGNRCEGGSGTVDLELVLP